MSVSMGFVQKMTNTRRWRWSCTCKKCFTCIENARLSANYDAVKMFKHVVSYNDQFMLFQHHKKTGRFLFFDK